MLLFTVNLSLWAQDQNNKIKREAFVQLKQMIEENPIYRLSVYDKSIISEKTTRSDFNLEQFRKKTLKNDISLSEDFQYRQLIKDFFGADKIHFLTTSLSPNYDKQISDLNLDVQLLLFMYFLEHKNKTTNINIDILNEVAFYLSRIDIVLSGEMNKKQRENLLIDYLIKSMQMHITEFDFSNHDRNRIAYQLFNYIKHIELKKNTFVKNTLLKGDSKRIATLIGIEIGATMFLLVAHGISGLYYLIEYWNGVDAGLRNLGLASFNILASYLIAEHISAKYTNKNVQATAVNRTNLFYYNSKIPLVGKFYSGYKLIPKACKRLFAKDYESKQGSKNDE